MNKCLDIREYPRSFYETVYDLIEEHFINLSYSKSDFCDSYLGYSGNDALIFSFPTTFKGAEKLKEITLSFCVPDGELPFISDGHAWISDRAKKYWKNLDQEIKKLAQRYNDNSSFL